MLNACDAQLCNGFTLGLRQNHKSWGPKHPLLDLTVRLKIGHQVGDWSLKLGGVYWLRTLNSWQQSDANFLFHILDSNPSVNYLHPKHFS